MGNLSLNMARAMRAHNAYSLWCTGSRTQFATTYTHSKCALLFPFLFAPRIGAHVGHPRCRHFVLPFLLLCVLFLLLLLCLRLLLLLPALRLHSLSRLGPLLLLLLERLSFLMLQPLASRPILFFTPVGVFVWVSVCVCVGVNVCVCVRVCVHAWVGARAPVRAHGACGRACLYVRARACVRMLSHIGPLNRKFIILLTLSDPLFTHLSCSSLSFSCFSCCAFVSCSFSLLSVSIRSLAWAHFFFSFSNASRFSCSNLSRPARSSFSRLWVFVCVCVCVWMCECARAYTRVRGCAPARARILCVWVPSDRAPGERSVVCWSRLQGVTRCGSVLQCVAGYCRVLRGIAGAWKDLHAATHSNTLQHTATHCNALQRTRRW